MTIDVWTIAGFIFTLLIFSYIFGDNLLFRLASYAFVGVTAGYVLVTVVSKVLVPLLWLPIYEQKNPLMLVPLGLGVLLMLKLAPSYARYGTLPMAFLVGVAAAVAIGGAVFGTLLGQAQGAINEFDMTTPAAQAGGPIYLVGAGVMLIGTISALAYFQFGTRLKLGQATGRSSWVEGLGQVGQVFISLTLGALFAGVFSASITALIERLDSIQIFIRSLIR